MANPTYDIVVSPAYSTYGATYVYSGENYTGGVSAFSSLAWAIATVGTNNYTAGITANLSEPGAVVIPESFSVELVKGTNLTLKTTEDNEVSQNNGTITVLGGGATFSTVWHEPAGVADEGYYDTLINNNEIHVHTAGTSTIKGKFIGAGQIVFHGVQKYSSSYGDIIADIRGEENDANSLLFKADTGKVVTRVTNSSIFVSAIDAENGAKIRFTNTELTVEETADFSGAAAVQIFGNNNVLEIGNLNGTLQLADTTVTLRIDNAEDGAMVKSVGPAYTATFKGNNVINATYSHNGTTVVNADASFEAKEIANTGKSFTVLGDNQDSTFATLNVGKLTGTITLDDGAELAGSSIDEDGGNAKILVGYYSDEEIPEDDDLAITSYTGSAVTFANKESEVNGEDPIGNDLKAELLVDGGIVNVAGDLKVASLTTTKPGLNHFDFTPVYSTDDPSVIVGYEPVSPKALVGTVNVGVGADAGKLEAGIVTNAGTIKVASGSEIKATTVNNAGTLTLAKGSTVELGTITGDAGSKTGSVTVGAANATIGTIENQKSVSISAGASINNATATISNNTAVTITKANVNANEISGNTTVTVGNGESKLNVTTLNNAVTMSNGAVLKDSTVSTADTNAIIKVGTTKSTRKITIEEETGTYTRYTANEVGLENSNLGATKIDIDGGIVNISGNLTAGDITNDITEVLPYEYDDNFYPIISGTTSYRGKIDIEGTPEDAEAETSAVRSVVTVGNITNAGDINVVLGDLTATGNISDTIEGDAEATGTVTFTNSTATVSGAIQNQDAVTVDNSTVTAKTGASGNTKIDIQNGGELVLGTVNKVDGEDVFTGAAFTNDGTVTVGAKVSNAFTKGILRAGAITNNGLFTVNSAEGTLLEAASFANTKTFTLNGKATIAGELSNTATANKTGVTVNAGGNLEAGTINNSGTFTANGTVTTTGKVTNANATTPANAKFTVGSTSATAGITATVASLENTGTVTVNKGKNSVKNSLLVGTVAKVDDEDVFTGGAVTNNGTIDVNGIMKAGAITNGTAAIGEEGDADYKKAVEGAITIGATGTLTATTITNNAGTITVSGELTATTINNIAGTITVDGSLTAAFANSEGATITVNAGGSVTALDGSSNAGAITVNAGGSLLGEIDNTGAITLVGSIGTADAGLVINNEEGTLTFNQGSGGTKLVNVTINGGVATTSNSYVYADELALYNGAAFNTTEIVGSGSKKAITIDASSSITATIGGISGFDITLSTADVTTVKEVLVSGTINNVHLFVDGSEKEVKNYRSVTINGEEYTLVKSVDSISLKKGVSQGTLYVSEAWATATAGQEVILNPTAALDDQKTAIFGYNAFNNILDALTAAQGMTSKTDIVLLSDSTATALTADFMFTGKGDITISSKDWDVEKAEWKAAEWTANIPIATSAKDKDFVMTPVSGTKIVISDGATISVDATGNTAGNNGSPSYAGCIWLDYTRNAGEVEISGTLKSTQQIWFGGNVTLTQTGSVDAKGQVCFRAGFNGPEAVVKVTGDAETEYTAETAQIKAGTTLEFTSGKVQTADTYIKGKVFKFSDDHQNSDWGLTLTSSNTTWDVSENGSLASGVSGYKDTVTFTNGTKLDVGTTADFGGLVNMTLKDSSVSAGTTLTNSGSISLEKGDAAEATGSSLSAKDLVNHGAIEATDSEVTVSNTLTNKGLILVLDGIVGGAVKPAPTDQDPDKVVTYDQDVLVSIFDAEGIQVGQTVTAKLAKRNNTAEVSVVADFSAQKIADGKYNVVAIVKKYNYSEEDPETYDKYEYNNFNVANASITLNNSTMTVGSSWSYNYGTIALTYGAKLLNASINNYGTITVEDSTLVLANLANMENGSVTVSDTANKTSTLKIDRLKNSTIVLDNATLKDSKFVVDKANNETGKLTIASSKSGTFTGTLEGNVDLENSGIAKFEGDKAQDIGAVTNNGTMNVSTKVVTKVGGKDTVTGGLTVASIANGAVGTSKGTLEITDGLQKVTGAITNESKSTSDNSEIKITGGTLNATSITNGDSVSGKKFGAKITVKGTLDASGTITNNKNSSITVDGGTLKAETLTNVDNAVFTVKGTSTVEISNLTGTLNLNGTLNDSTVKKGTATTLKIAIASSTTGTFTGTLTSDVALENSGTAEFKGSKGQTIDAVTNNGTMTVSNTNGLTAASVENKGDMTISGKLTTTGNFTHNSSSKEVTVSGTLNAESGVTITQGTVTVTGTLNAKKGSGTNLTYKKITVGSTSKSGTLNANGTLTAGEIEVIKGTFSVASGKTATANGKVTSKATVNVNGTLDVKDNAGVAVETGKFNVSGTLKGGKPLDIGTTSSNATVDISGSATVGAVTLYGKETANTLTVSGTLNAGAITVTKGTFTIAKTATVTATSITNSDAMSFTANQTGATITVTDTFTNEGSLTIDASDITLGDGELLKVIAAGSVSNRKAITVTGNTNVTAVEGADGIYLRGVGGGYDTTVIYLNTAWAGYKPGDTVIFGDKELVFGSNAFATAENLALGPETVALVFAASNDSYDTLNLTDSNVATITVAGAGAAKFTDVIFSAAKTVDVSGQSVSVTGEEGTTLGNKAVLDLSGTSQIALGTIDGNGTIKASWDSKLSFSDFDASESGADTLIIDVSTYCGNGNTVVTDAKNTNNYAGVKVIGEDGEIAGGFDKYFTVSNNDLSMNTANRYVTYVSQTISGIGYDNQIEKSLVHNAEVIRVLDGTYGLTYFKANPAKVYIGKAEAGLAPVHFTSGVYGGELVNELETRPYNKVDAEGDINLTVNSGSFDKIVAAGDRIQVTSTTKKQGFFVRTGNTNLTINGGTFTQYVVGGQVFQPTDSLSFAQITQTNLTINGGTFNNYIYGGSMAGNKAASGRTFVGSTNITINAGATAININAGLRVGSYGYGAVTGDTTLTLTGVGDNLYAKALWGGSGEDFWSIAKDETRTYEGFVSGSRILSFEGFTGILNCGSIDDFSDVVVDKKSSVTLLGTVSLNHVDNWDLSYGVIGEGDDAVTSGLLGGFSADLNGDTMKLTTTGLAKGASWQVIGDGATLKNYDQLMISFNGDTAVAYNNGGWTSADGKLKVTASTNGGMLLLA